MNDSVLLVNIFPACFNLFTRAFIRGVCEIREEKWKIVAGGNLWKIWRKFTKFQTVEKRVRGSLRAHGFSKTVPRKFAYLEPWDERDSGVTRPNKTISRLVSSHSPIWIFPPRLFTLCTHRMTRPPFPLSYVLTRDVRFCFAILFRDLPRDTL